MYPLQFHVIRLQDFEVIRIAGIPVYLTVYLAESPLFHPLPEEKRYYCQARDRLLVIETTGYNKFIDPFHLQSLYAAIKWYGRSKFNIPDMEIRLTDPRRSSRKQPLN